MIFDMCIQNFLFLSDTVIPTVDLGIENTEKGHCAKTIAILKYLSNRYKENESIKFVVIADDDTILRLGKFSENSSNFTMLYVSYFILVFLVCAKFYHVMDSRI